jgi:hypothetical protein
VDKRHREDHSLKNVARQVASRALLALALIFGVDTAAARGLAAAHAKSGDGEAFFEK